MKNRQRKLLILTVRLIAVSVVGLTACSEKAIDSGSTQSPKILTLDNIFPSNRLIRVDIELPNQDWNLIRHQSRSVSGSLHPKRQFEPLESPYTYVEASVTIDGVVMPQVGLRKKGFIGSRSSSRPSLKIKLNYTDQERDIEGLTTLTLNNNLQDTSLMSQFIGYSFFRSAGSPAPRCAFAKVTVNGVNLGVYTHVESAKRPMVEHSFGNSNGTLYEGTLADFYENWQGSFDRKFGKDKPGREHIVKVINTLNEGEGDVVLGGRAPGRAWVPTSGMHDDQWFLPDFDDSDWIPGENGAGYERDSGYDSLITEDFDFEEEMYGKTTSLYLRFTFQVSDIEDIESAARLLLRMRCDDGFVAYINGSEVARFNAPKSPSWNSKASRTDNDRALIMFSAFDISQHKNKLRRGRNVLAVHCMNNGTQSSDLLLVAELQTSDHTLEEGIWQLIDEESFYTFWTIEGLLSFWDGYSGNRNNFFIYLNPATDKFHFLPWGADCMFEKYSPLGVSHRSPRSVRTVGLLAHKLYQIPSVRKKYAARMRKLIDEHWNEEKLLAESDRIEALVDPHLSSKQRGWWFHRNVDYDKVRRFIRKRRRDVEREISGEDMPHWNVVPKPVFAN